MTGPAVLLTLAYVAVAALLLSLNLATRYRAAVKAAAIVVVSLLYVGAWQGTRGLMGWPTADPMPEEFRVLWITIEEPDKGQGLPGSIYYWARSLDEAGLPDGAPRAYALPWSEEEAESAQSALDRMEEGELLDGRRTRAALSQAEGDASSSEEDWGTRGSVGQDERRPLFEFMPVAPPTLPAKGPIPKRLSPG
ncbi:MAG: hypothetical protein NZ990_16505 [Myxococcota bacterium]|nr:hypothetical protein [Myxococcota bacterium]